MHEHDTVAPREERQPLSGRLLDGGPGSSVQWNLYATTLPGVTKEQAQYKASVQAVSYPEATWVIIEPHNQWMTNRTALSYDY